MVGTIGERRKPSGDASYAPTRSSRSVALSADPGSARSQRAFAIPTSGAGSRRVFPSALTQERTLIHTNRPMTPPKRPPGESAPSMPSRAEARLWAAARDALYGLVLFLGPVLAVPAAAAQPDTSEVRTAVVDSSRSRIDYVGSAVAHNWRGTSHDVSGHVKVDVDNPIGSTVRLTVPVASFDSGNDRRDRNMRETLEVEQYPLVRFHSDSIRVENWGRTSRNPSGHAGQWIVRGPLTFHGRTRPLETTVRVRIDGDSLSAETSFPVSLTRFDVDRPELFFVPIGDTLRIEAEIHAAFRRPSN